MPSIWDRIISALVTWIKKYLQSERSEMRQIWIDPSNVCWDHLDSFWKHIMIIFSHRSLFYRWNILKIWGNLSKWNMDVLSISFAHVLHPNHVDYVHHLSYMCAPCASDVASWEDNVHQCIYPFHICEVLAVNHMQMRRLSHTWSGWDVFWEVHCMTWLFSQKVWEWEFVVKNLNLQINFEVKKLMNFSLIITIENTIPNQHV